MRIAAVIVAAGRGTRASRDGSRPKQYVPLAGVPILRRTLDALFACPGIGPLQVVIHADDADAYAAAIVGLARPPLAPVTGGPTRQASVLAGLEATGLRSG